MFDKVSAISYLKVLVKAPSSGVRLLEVKGIPLGHGLSIRPKAEQQNLFLEIMKVHNGDLDYFYKNTEYLEGLGLVETYYDGEKYDKSARLEPDNLNLIKITSKGRDYLNDDGGISAELSTVTIKIHTATLLQLEELINSAKLTDGQKMTLKQQLKEKGVEAFASKCMESLFSSSAALLPILLNLLK